MGILNETYALAHSGQQYTVYFSDREGVTLDLSSLQRALDFDG
jgi:hypothetical protein